METKINDLKNWAFHIVKEFSLNKNFQKLNKTLDTNI
jgi:hypothetical protein